MRKKLVIIIPIAVIFLSSFSGCFEFFSGDNGLTVYQSHPTKISYDISYGYKFNCNGSGKYSIKYNCDKPELVNGEIDSIIPTDNNYTNKNLATHNEVFQWEFIEYGNSYFNLGLTANVESESYLISDLSGSNALEIEEIKQRYPSIVKQYCKPQSNETIIFINPQDTEISYLANQIKDDAGTNNSFIIAKDFFKWLKQYTTYKTHLNNNVQPANFTLECKTGDCDDLSYLYISMCRSVGIPSRFIRGFLIEGETAISHAWVEVFVGGNIGKSGWIPIECAGVSGDIKTEINQNFGVESSEHIRLFTDDGSNESLNISMSTLYIIRYSQNIQIDTKSYSDIENYKIIDSKELVIDEKNNRYYQ